VRISRELYDELVAHAREDAPAECCGMVATAGDEAVAVHRAVNVHPRPPLGYEIEGTDQLRIQNAIDDAGHELGAIYHSHTRSAPLPSQTDINLAFYPDALYIIVGVAEAEPDVRAWRIADGAYEPAELTVEEG
jgi:proteasome lid subunit RPN8/RPN11